MFQVHGHDRKRELFEATKQGSALVVEHDGSITGYATLIGFFGHAVGRTNEELKALIGATPAFQSPASCCRPGMATCSVGVSSMACAWSIQ